MLCAGLGDTLMLHCSQSHTSIGRGRGSSVLGSSDEWFWVEVQVPPSGQRSPIFQGVRDGSAGRRALYRQCVEGRPILEPLELAKGTWRGSPSQVCAPVLAHLVQHVGVELRVMVPT